MLSLRLHRRRAGLSTLEMVLALPILLFIMALMINYGTVACWKVRGLTMARYSVWGSRWPRTGNSNPRPDYWPATASLGGRAAANAPELDDPRVNQPVVRGPLPGANVRQDLLDPTRGGREGVAGLTRDYPLLGKLGPYHLDAISFLLDNKWQYQRTYLGSNRQRRIPVLYELAKAPAGLADAYVRAVLAIFNAPFRTQLRPLDQDDEFVYYGARCGWGANAPDFHPYLHQFCSTDRELADAAVQDVIDRIQGKVERDAEGHVRLRIPSVAETMTRAFIDLYQRVIRYDEDLLQATPPPSPAESSRIRDEIRQLRAKIEILQKFLGLLQK